MEQYMAYIWIAVAVIMAVLEMATVQLVSVWFVIGAVCAAVTSLLTDSVLIQFSVFVAVSLIALLVTRPLVKKLKKSTKIVSTNADRIIGCKGDMLTDLSDSDAVGQAKVNGSVWSVKCDNPPLKSGDKVLVLAIEGVKLIVEKTD